MGRELAQRDVTIKIPAELLRQFEKDVRVVIRHPWVIGIPIPEILLRPELIKDLKEEFDIMLVPKELQGI